MLSAADRRDFCDNSSCRDDGENSGTEVPFRRPVKLGPRTQPPISVGHVIRQRREALALSRENLARKTGLPLPLIGAIEDATRDVYLDDLRRIATAFGTSLTHLLWDALTVTRRDVDILTDLYAVVSTDGR